MTKIEQIQDAIRSADNLQSKMTQEAWNVPALASLRGRHLLNNLGAICKYYLEIGVHKGGTFCSTVCGNKLAIAIAIDSFESDEPYHNDQAEPQFMANSKLLLDPETSFFFIKQDSFKVDLADMIFSRLIPPGIDFYFFDGSHSREDQKKALLHYKTILAEEFIYVCDDWDYGEVKEGTMEGIEQGGYEILFQQELHGAKPGEHDNESWWRGYAVFLLKKKP